jgi:hypothetical protein
MSDLRAIAEAATPGPWRWFGQEGRTIVLATVGRGVLTVMGAKRLGMQGAELTFPVWQNPESKAIWGWGGKLTGASKMAVLEVPYRADVTEIDHPNAAHIAAWSPDRALAALDVIDTVRRKHQPSEHRVRCTSCLCVWPCEEAAALDRWDALG